MSKQELPPTDIAQSNELDDLRERLQKLEESLGIGKASGAAKAAAGDVPDKKPKAGWLVSSLLCLPLIMMMAVLLNGHFTVAWYCRPGRNTCPITTSEPIRLASYTNFVWMCLASIPLLVMMLAIAAVRYVGDLARIHEGSFGEEGGPAEVEKKARLPSKTEVVLYVLLYATLITAVVVLYLPHSEHDGLPYSVAVNFTAQEAGLFGVFIVVIVVIPPLIIISLRNLRVAIIRRRKEGTAQYIRDHVWPRIAPAAILQFFCFSYSALYASGSPWVARSSIDGRFFLDPACPEWPFPVLGELYPGESDDRMDLNATYLNTFCTSSYSAEFNQVILQCNDGGYDRYPSRVTSCMARSVYWDIHARVICHFFVGIGALLTVVIPEWIAALDTRLTLSNWPSTASPRVLASILLVGMGWLGSFVLLGVGIMPFDHGLFSPRRLGNTLWLTFALEITGFVGAILLIAIEFGSRKLRKWEKRKKEEKEKKEKAEDGKKAEEKKEVCGFWFVRASYIREAEWPPGKWKSFQELRDEPDALKPVEISSRAVFSGRGQEKYGEHLAISHRWETPTNPDPSGVQMEEIKQYLKAHRNIKFVWCDYW